MVSRVVCRSSQTSARPAACGQVAADHVAGRGRARRPPRRSLRRPPRPRLHRPLLPRPCAAAGGPRVHRAQGLLAGLDDHRVGEDDVEHLIGDLDGHLAAARLFRLLVAGALRPSRRAACPSARRCPRQARRAPRRRPSSRPQGPRAAGGATRQAAARPAARPAAARPRRPGCRASRARRRARRGGREARPVPGQPLPQPAEHGVGLLGALRLPRPGRWRTRR